MSTRKHLALKLLEDFDPLGKSDMEYIIDCFYQVIADYVLEKGSRVEIRGFGVFYPRELGDGEIYNPTLKTKIKCNKRYKIAFKAGSDLNYKKLS